MKHKGKSSWICPQLTDPHSLITLKTISSIGTRQNECSVIWGKTLFLWYHWSFYELKWTSCIRRIFLLPSVEPFESIHFHFSSTSPYLPLCKARDEIFDANCFRFLANLSHAPLFQSICYNWSYQWSIQLTLQVQVECFRSKKVLEAAETPVA